MIDENTPLKCIKCLLTPSWERVWYSSLACFGRPPPGGMTTVTLMHVLTAAAVGPPERQPRGQLPSGGTNVVPYRWLHKCHYERRCRQERLHCRSKIIHLMSAVCRANYTCPRLATNARHVCRPGSLITNCSLKTRITYVHELSALWYLKKQF